MGSQVRALLFPPSGPVAQLVRALACHARGRWFEPHPGRQLPRDNSSGKGQSRLLASVAQLVEQGTENPRVVGSIPTGGTTYADLAHLVERDLAKVEVAGSIPVIRSKHGYESNQFVPVIIRRRSQAVRQRSAKPSFPGPIPGDASKKRALQQQCSFFAFDRIVGSEPLILNAAYDIMDARKSLSLRRKKE